MVLDPCFTYIECTVRLCNRNTRMVLETTIHSSVLAYVFVPVEGGGRRDRGRREEGERRGEKGRGRREGEERRDIR